MTTNQNTPTCSTANAHNEQPAADTKTPEERSFEPPLTLTPEERRQIAEAEEKEFLAEERKNRLYEILAFLAVLIPLEALACLYWLLVHGGLLRH
jgi:hypothetical protein